MPEKLDVLAIGVHPDDVELGCGGTLARLIDQGKRVGIVDLTRGELGSRGSAELRDQEATAAGEVLGIQARENLGLQDGFFAHNEKNVRTIICSIRHFQPEILLIGAPEDRHPDHGRSSKLVRDAMFLSGLRKIETERDGQAQLHWRPKQFFFYIQDYALTPDFVVDIGPYFEIKKKSIQAYGSQFYNPAHDEPETYISTAEFWNFIEARARDMGHRAGITMGEGFLSEVPLKIERLTDLL